ncbi:MAG: putative 2OG-Fe(II) oxygenase [Pseudomonadota bacterium]|nr:putative 2OG-Fe(II) oxygenase [Pseudomonadota bacterium]
MNKQQPIDTNRGLNRPFWLSDPNRYQNLIELGNEIDPCALFQPWSTPVMGSRVPDKILNSMLEMTDSLLGEPGAKSHRKSLAGQISQETKVDLEVLKKSGLNKYFESMVVNYVKAALTQRDFDLANLIQKTDYLTEIRDMWVVSQKPGEYNPLHYHSGCHVSAVLYLKLPKMLPSEKKDLGQDSDGAIFFAGPPSADFTFSQQQFSVKPKVGDIYLFAANQLHGVYPFRVSRDDHNDERRSVSFNAIFQARSDFESGKPMSVLF